MHHQLELTWQHNPRTHLTHNLNTHVSPSLALCHHTMPCTIVAVGACVGHFTVVDAGATHGDVGDNGQLHVTVVQCDQRVDRIVVARNGLIDLEWGIARAPGVSPSQHHFAPVGVCVEGLVGLETGSELEHNFLALQRCGLRHGLGARLVAILAPTRSSAFVAVHFHVVATQTIPRHATRCQRGVARLVVCVVGRTVCIAVHRLKPSLALSWGRQWWRCGLGKWNRTRRPLHFNVIRPIDKADDVRRIIGVRLRDFGDERPLRGHRKRWRRAAARLGVLIIRTEDVRATRLLGAAQTGAIQRHGASARR
eukprot:m.256149 g.256149  ORF g.256149 m.256149 type:complete len:309 (+) comp19627_c0_seq3:985-1911(+)